MGVQRQATKAQVTRIANAINREFPDKNAQPSHDNQLGWTISVASDALDVDYTLAGHASIPANMYLEPLDDTVLGLFYHC
ncbi:hypothetical protein [Mycolicibacterium sp.]|uniref:hypothetical protein n=1 Tax=Mycolicibacterium sp. TaxID=2320850 RepID=UPI0037C6DC5A